MGTNWTTNANIGQFPASAIDAGGLPGAIVQEIDDLRSDRTILAALPDVLAIDLAAQGERLPDGALAALTAPGTATHYRVLSRPQELAAPPRFDGPPPDLSSYLVLPAGYPQRVADLAVAVAGSRTTPYQRALALEAYLRGLNYTYTVQPIPIGGDAVGQFLFTMRAGYCTYYASAMAVMARSLGIPARLAIGYATGEYDQASGAYLVLSLIHIFDLLAHHHHSKIDPACGQRPQRREECRRPLVVLPAAVPQNNGRTRRRVRMIGMLPGAWLWRLGLVEPGQVDPWRQQLRLRTNRVDQIELVMVVVAPRQARQRRQEGRAMERRVEEQRIGGQRAGVVNPRERQIARAAGRQRVG